MIEITEEELAALELRCRLIATVRSNTSTQKARLIRAADAVRDLRFDASGTGLQVSDYSVASCVEQLMKGAPAA